MLGPVRKTVISMIFSERVHERFRALSARWRVPHGAPSPLEGDLIDAHPAALQGSDSSEKMPTGPGVSVHVPDIPAEDTSRYKYQKSGQRLARQEDWAELSSLIKDADDARLMTQGGMAVADLFGFGARADVVWAAEHALAKGRGANNATLLDGIEALETVLLEHPGDHAIALIVAQAHMDIARAWRTGTKGSTKRALSTEACRAHFDRAEDILNDFADYATQSPAMAFARCGLRRTKPAARAGLANDFANAIDLNPSDPRPMRMLGRALLPTRYGSLDQLELEARRTAARTERQWGAGGYTWVMFEAIVQNAEACARLDLPFFMDGLKDILKRQSDAFTANIMASYCAITMHKTSGNTGADAKRAVIASAEDWIVRDHLSELHPLLWAQADQSFDHRLRIRSVHRFAEAGKAVAQTALERIFSAEIRDGARVSLTTDGPRIQAA